MLKHLVLLFITHKEMDKHINKVIGILLPKLINEKKYIGMNIYPQFYFHIGQLTRWQHDIYLTN